jgi:drug/metabolite transporter (DMT)-like permease
MIGCSFLCFLGLFFFIKSIQNFKFSNVIILSVVGNLTQQLVASYILLEKNSISFWISFFVMITGVIIQASVNSTRKGLAWILLSSIFWPMGYSLMSIPLKKTSVWWSISITEMIILAISFLVLVIAKRRIKIKILWDKRHITIMLIAVLTITGSVFLNSSYQTIKLSNLGIYQLSVLPLTYLLSLKIFKEKPSLIDIISFIFIFSGFVIC